MSKRHRRFELSIEKYNVFTHCASCGGFNRVAVEFPDWNAPFKTTQYTCEHCGQLNTLFDEHKYDKEGFIL